MPDVNASSGFSQWVELLELGIFLQRTTGKRNLRIWLLEWVFTKDGKQDS